MTERPQFETRLERLLFRRRQRRRRLTHRAVSAALGLLAMLAVVLSPGISALQQSLPVASTDAGDGAETVKPTTEFAEIVDRLVAAAGARTAVAGGQSGRVDVTVVGSNSADALTIGEAVDIALGANPELDAAEAREDQAEAGLALANQALQAAQMQSGMVDPTDPTAVQEAAQAELEAQFNVIDAGGAVSLAGNATTYAEAMTSHMVRTAFYGLLQANDLLEVANHALDQANEQLKLTKTQYDVGVVARRDVVAAESQVAEMEANVAAAGKGLQLVALNLNRLLGRAQLTHDLKVVRPSSGVPDLELGSAAQAETLDYALEQRLDIVQQRTASEGAQQKLALLSAVSDPTFAALLENQVALIEAQGDEAEAKLDSATAQAEYDVRSVYLEAAELQERSELAEQNYAYSEDLARLARLRFENGLSTALEVSAAQTGLMKVGAERVQARYQLILVESKLDLVKRGPLSMGGATTGGAETEIPTNP